MSEHFEKIIERAKQEIQRLTIELKAEKQRTAIASEYSNFALWEYDIATDICYQHKKLDGKYADILEPIVHFRDTVISWGIVCTEDLPVFKHFCDDMKAGKKKVGCDVRVVDDNGDTVWYRYEGKTVYDEDGNPVKVVGRTLDVTQEKGGKSETADAKKDPLTKTYSPEVFRDLIAEKRGGIKRYNSAALMCIGIDDFRGIETRAGKEYADYIQKTVAEILLGFCSAERDSLLTRIRDGEFLLYLGLTGNRSLDEIAQRIIVMVREHEYKGESAAISMGVSMLKSAKKLEETYNEAAVALGEAVKSGGGCFVRYSMAMSMRLYDRPSELSLDADSTTLSGGAARVYGYIIRAFCSPNERTALIKEAFKAAGQIIGASTICIYYKKNGGYERSRIFCSEDRLESECPGLEISGSEEYLEAVFGDENAVRIHSADIMYNELRLVNGAVCAECRATRFDGHIDILFAAVFASSFELNDGDIQVLDVLETALSAMYRDYENSMAENVRQHLNTTAMSNHRMEDFSIIPGTFEVDDVGDNAAEHYELCKGDICYKKVRGLDAPCDGCPAVQLEQKGILFASSAYYFEKERRWLDVTASVGESVDGERRYIISSTDITDCLGMIQMSDQLTGLMTFNAFTAEALRLTAMQGDTNGMLMVVINIANFNRLNEDKGYELGDSILITMADIVQQCIGEGELLCRSEDSRFTALLRSADIHGFESRMNIMLNSIQKQIYDKFQVRIYLLAGVCDMGDAQVGVMGAVDRAIGAQKTIRDRSFYTENLIAFYDSVMREKIEERRFIESNMLAALENNEFNVYYQPKVNIDTGKVVGAEALVRWKRPDGSIISPGKFVPIFEENGFVTEMDFAIYRQAVADIARWLRMGIEVPLISLNVSRRHLADDNFCDKFNALVDGLGVPHDYIELEITESLLTENLNKLVDVAEWFKGRDYRISIDDFGSGYSSLNLITMLPFDTLKIDGGFFLRNDLTDKNKKVITSVVSLAKSLNLETVSEGVETQKQVDFLKELGCDMIQGFFYYKPMAGEDFEKLLAAQSNIPV